MRVALLTGSKYLTTAKHAQHNRPEIALADNTSKKYSDYNMQIRLPKSAYGTKWIGIESNSVIQSETGATQESLLKNLKHGILTRCK
jgi:hypothetical protein